MELTSVPTLSESWTATVVWARPWHRPSIKRRAPAHVPEIVWKSARPAATEIAPEHVLEAAWTAAVAELAGAGEALRVLRQDTDDPWPEQMARHALFQARRRVRLAQEALTGADAGLPWSTPG